MKAKSLTITISKDEKANTLDVKGVISWHTHQGELMEQIVREDSCMTIETAEKLARFTIQDWIAILDKNR